VLITFTEESTHVGIAVGANKPGPPVADVGIVANAIRPPSVVGVADEVIVVAQSAAQAAIVVGQPVLTGRVMDKDEFCC